MVALIVSAVVLVLGGGIWALVALDRLRSLDRFHEWCSWGESEGLSSLQTPTGLSPWLGSTVTPVPLTAVQPLDGVPGLPAGTIQYFLSGVYRGHDVRLFHHSYVVHAGKTSIVINHHVFAVKVPLSVPWFGVRCHRLWDRVARAFGHPDLEIGDQEFDRRYYVFGKNEQEVAQCLTPTARRIITDSDIQTWSRVGDWLVSVGNEVSPGQPAEARLNELIALANALG